jgi:hypothetical protein
VFLQTQLFQMPIVVEYSSTTNDRRCLRLAFFKVQDVF